jgi:Fe-S-cluster containining protein
MNLPTCCLDFDILVTDLLFPDLMGLDGQEFVKAHGIGQMTLDEIQANSEPMPDLGHGPQVKLHHRCSKLQDDGRCGIYEKRPAICRAFDCRTRRDCACNGQGIIPLEQA